MANYSKKPMANVKVVKAAKPKVMVNKPGKVAAKVGKVAVKGCK